MRAVFIGAGSLTMMGAGILLKRLHEVVIIEQNLERIEAVREGCDCSFIHGDGSKPAILRECAPKETDTLFCLTSNDQTNILASLVGRSLGFRHIITKIADPEFEHICIELGLENTIVPNRTIAQHLADMFEGQDPLELSTMIREDARVFSFVAREEDAMACNALELPETSRVICVYRDSKFILPDADTMLKVDDEVVLITHRKHLPELHQRWNPAVC
jgi:trk system potassium uptake protein TrkA